MKTTQKTVIQKGKHYINVELLNDLSTEVKVKIYSDISMIYLIQRVDRFPVEEYLDCIFDAVDPDISIEEIESRILVFDLFSSEKHISNSISKRKLEFFNSRVYGKIKSKYSKLFHGRNDILSKVEIGMMFLIIDQNPKRFLLDFDFTNFERLYISNRPFFNRVA